MDNLIFYKFLIKGLLLSKNIFEILFKPKLTCHKLPLIDDTLHYRIYHFVIIVLPRQYSLPILETEVKFDGEAYLS